MQRMSNVLYSLSLVVVLPILFVLTAILCILGWNPDQSEHETFKK